MDVIHDEIMEKLYDVCGKIRGIKTQKTTNNQDILRNTDKSGKQAAGHNDLFKVSYQPPRK